LERLVAGRQSEKYLSSPDSAVGASIANAVSRKSIAKGSFHNRATGLY
jgi:hypothetical protein